MTFQCNDLTSGMKANVKLSQITNDIPGSGRGEGTQADATTSSLQLWLLHAVDSLPNDILV